MGAAAWRGAGPCRLLQALRLPTIASTALTFRAKPGRFKDGRLIMGVIVLEAAGALLLLCFVVWWTMFSGRHRGELDDDAGVAVDAVGAPDQVADDADVRGGNKKLKG
jgi:hypothetical protein